jgi:transposase-like protein
MCRQCGRYCTDKPARFSAQTRAMAIRMYLNSVGIRAIGRILEASPATVLNWIRKEHAAMEQRLAQAEPVRTDEPDIIEMDEIYTYVQKNKTAP